MVFAVCRLIQPTNFLPHWFQIAQFDLRHFADGKLCVHVFAVIQQHAFCLYLITPCSARFLQIIFQRAGDFSVNNQAYVRFIHAHTKGVGSDNNAQTTANKLVLNIGFFVVPQACVEMLTCPALFFQVSRIGFRTFPPSDKYHGSTALMIKFTMQQLVDFLLFKAIWNLQHIIKQIVALVVTNKLAELNTSLFTEMVSDVGEDIGFGSSSKTTYRSHRTVIFAVFSDKFDCV